MKSRCSYEFYVTHGTENHIWKCIVAKGAIHLHIHKHKDCEHHGGIEIHHRSPPDYMKNDPPSQDECWILKAPCWHDGSSLAASEIWIPRWLADPHDHERMLDSLTAEAERCFRESDK